MIEFKQVTTAAVQIIEIMTTWYNDESIRHFIRPNFKEAPYEECPMEMIQQSLGEKNRYCFIAYEGKTPLGEVTILVDPPYLARKVPKTSWISIMIGNPTHRGKGFGVEMMKFLEEKSREMGMVRIELGVFDFNVNAVKFYQRLGYTPFHEFENFTYWNGKWHKDMRMEKYL